MRATTRLWVSLGFLILGWGVVVVADTKRLVEQHCPLCSTDFKAMLSMSGTQFGQRLDLRPVGAITSPWPLPVCPKCGLVLYKNSKETYSADELKQLRGIIEAEPYRKLDPKAPSHQRLAKLYEGLKRPPQEIAHVYLMASWQTEKDEKVNRAMLAKSLEWFGKSLASPPEKEGSRETEEFLRGELLRRLGKFEEAKQQFDRLAKMTEFKKEPFPQLIAQELSLIHARDATPHEMERKRRPSA